MTSHELMSLIETRRDMCMQALASDAAGFSLDPETVPDSAGDRAGDDTQLPVLRSIPGESLSLPPHYRSAEKKKVISVWCLPVPVSPALPFTTAYVRGME